jgi:PAS domain S-box-containing protein
MMFITDNRGFYLNVNEAFTRYTGYAREEVLGRSIDDVMVWVDHHQRGPMVEKLHRNGCIHDKECRFYNKFGQIQTVLLSIETVTLGGSKCRLGVSLDITERIEAEEALRISDAAFKSIHEGVVVMDMDDIVLHWNHVSEEMLGIPAAEAIGRNVNELVILLEAYPGQNDDRQQVLQERGFNREEQRYQTRNGIIWVDVSVQMIEKNGDRVGKVALVVDITQRKLDEGKLRAAYRQEKELRQTLEKEAQRRLEFSRALVHELKTPLTPILASSELLMSGLTEEPWLSMARNIFRGGENLSRRIDELLDLARGEIGMLKVSLSMFSPADLITELVSEMTPFAVQRDQKLSVHLPEKLPDVRGDVVRLRQVIANLVNNACKFTGDGGEIDVSARAEDGNLIVEVKDNGMGLTEVEKTRLFQPYERGEADRQRLSGLGLGLALSKNLVELHGGTVWVRSWKNKGSTFGFSIPVDGPANRETR